MENNNNQGGNTNLAALIADDGYAMTFQSMGQYRTALLKAIDAAPIPPLTAPAPLTDKPSYWNSQRKMIERAIVGLRDGWATRKDADDALAVLGSTWAAPAPQQSENIHCQEFHELAMAYRSAPAFRANEPYSELVAYIDSKITAAKAAPDAPVQTAWQPIETAPKMGRELVLLLTPSRFPQVAYSNTWWTSGFSIENKPTHWMPLPAAPSTGEASDQGGTNA